MFNTQKNIASGEYELVRDLLCSVRCNYPECTPEECSQLEVIKVKEDYIVVCPKSQLVNLALKKRKLYTRKHGIRLSPFQNFESNSFGLPLIGCI